MRIGLNLILLIVGVAISAAIWFASGGRFAFFFLPLLLGLPLMFNPRR